jgi:hypothetical protein
LPFGGGFDLITILLLLLLLLILVDALPCSSIFLRVMQRLLPHLELAFCGFDFKPVIFDPIHLLLDLLCLTLSL